MASIDERIGKNLARYRGSMSQRELANRVRDFGLKWTHLTVASIERGDRPLRASESVLLMQLLNIPNFEALLSNEKSTRLRMLIDRAKSSLQRAELDVFSIMRDQRDLQDAVAKLGASDEEIDDDLVAALEELATQANNFISSMETYLGELPKEM